jgi:hypothetical protein
MKDHLDMTFSRLELTIYYEFTNTCKFQNTLLRKCILKLTSICEFILCFDCIIGVMLLVLALSVVDREFKSTKGHIQMIFHLWLFVIRDLYALVSSTNKTDCHDITEILLKVALNPINPRTHYCIPVNFNNKYAL